MTGRTRRWHLAAALTLALLGMAIPASAQEDAPPRCDGEVPTIVGTDGPDRIEGTAGDDVIVALGGNDVVFGRGGDDVICGGAGRDRLIGGAGRDVLAGEAGRDTLRGGPGADLIGGGTAGDRSSGGPGNDVLIDEAGNDLLRGGKGADLLDGGPGRDRCSGDSGYDAVGSGCEVGRWDAAVRIVDVDGVVIRFVGESSTVPPAGGTVMISVLMADRDAGPTMCLGSFTLRPGCSGPVIDGLTMSPAWASQQFGELMGSRFVELSWPPIDNHVQLIDERSALGWPSSVLPGLSSFDPARFARPLYCEHLDRTTAVGLDALQAWGAENPAEYGGTYTAGAGPTPAIRGIPAMQVKASDARLESIRAELSTNDMSPCLVSVSFTAIELATTRAQLDALRIPGRLSSGTTRDRVVAEVVAIDRDTVDAIVAAVDRPDLVELKVEAILR